MDKRLAILLILAPLLAGAYEPDRMELRPYLFHSFGQRNQMWSIAQDPHNRVLYFANSEGLLRYNGIGWEKHSLDEQLPVRSVEVDARGNIFTGSFEEFGYWQYDDLGELHYRSLTGGVEVETNDDIWKIHIMGDKVYFQSFTSLYIYDYQTVEKQMAPFTMLFMFAPWDGLPVVQILDSGLYWYDGEGFRFIEGSAFLGTKKVHDIVHYRDSTLLVCTANDGLYLFDGEEFTGFASEASDFLRRYTCNAAKKINDSTFAFGSILNGLIIADDQGRIQERYNADNGLGNNTVLSLFRDADHGLWIGLDHGVHYIDLLSPFTQYKSRNGTLGTIYALLEHDEWLYIGTNHGLFRAGMERKGNSYHFHDLEFIPGSHGQVWTLEEFDNQVICGHNDGIFLVSGRSMEQISTVSGGWSFIPYDRFILGGTYTDIVVLEPDPRHRQIRFRNVLQNHGHPTRYLETDYLGYVWASHHQRGIYKIEMCGELRAARETVHYPSINDKSYNIRVFKVNNRIVFATGENIYTFDFVRNEIVPFTSLAEHLGKYKNATQIIPHRDNTYWMVKENSLALFGVGLDFSATLEYEIVHEGIQLPHRNIQLAFPDDHTVLIPNPYSFDLYDLTLHGAREGGHQLAIERLRFRGRKDSVVFFGPSDNVSVPWHTNTLEVSFRDPALFDRTQKAYEYRIRELGHDWLTTANDHFSFMDLRHGSYTLEIRADEDNVIVREFSIRKPWFYSHIAIVVYGMLFLMIVWGLYLFFRFELRRHKNLVLLEIRQNSLERELDYKGHELMLTMRHLIRKDNILNNLQRHIQDIKEQYARYPVKQINKMERVIREGFGSQNVEWENAAQNLRLSQQGFFKALKDKYSDLTPNDLRLCAYLRLNLTTKEIAQMLNISPRGVEISRHRLRKKLGLSKDEHLFDFLMREEFNLSDNNTQGNRRR